MDSTISGSVMSITIAVMPVEGTFLAASTAMTLDLETDSRAAVSSKV